MSRGNVFADSFLNSEAEMKRWIFNARMLLSHSCIFVWRLAPELTISMRARLCQLRQNPNAPPCKTSSLRWNYTHTHTHTHTHTTTFSFTFITIHQVSRIKAVQNAHHVVWLCCSRREIHSAPLLGGLSSDSDREPEEEEEEEEEEEDGAENEDANDPEDIATNTSSDSSHGEEDTGTVQTFISRDDCVVVHRRVSEDPPSVVILTFISPRRAACDTQRSNTVLFHYFPAASHYRALSCNRWLGRRAGLGGADEGWWCLNDPSISFDCWENSLYVGDSMFINFTQKYT